MNMCGPGLGGHYPSGILWGGVGSGGSRDSWSGERTGMGSEGRQKSESLKKVL